MPTNLADLPVTPVQLDPGATMPEFEIGPITRTDIVRYAGASGDFNRIHHDEPFAVDAGLPGVFSMGMFQGGVVAQRLASWVGPRNVKTFRLRFTGQVWPGDVLTIAGRVDSVDDHLATCSVTATRQNGDVVIAGEATVIIA